MPNQNQVIENAKKQAKGPEIYYNPLKEQDQQLYKNSLMQTYLHNKEQNQIYKKKAKEHNQIPPENGSFSGFKKMFKRVGRFLTGIPNYYELSEKIDNNWSAFNLEEVSEKLTKKSDDILKTHKKVDSTTKKEEYLKDDVYSAFTEMAKNGQFFDNMDGQDALMNLEAEHFNHFESTIQDLENYPEYESQKKALKDTVNSYKSLKKYMDQLKYFKNGNGSLSSANISALKEDLFSNNDGSKFIFELVTGVKASNESFEYAAKKHPHMIQMIFYTQLLNHMDIAINQILSGNVAMNQLPTEIFGDAQEHSFVLNLKQYAHLQAQKKETNRLLTTLMSQTDIQKDFDGKFPYASIKKESDRINKKDTKVENELKQESDKTESIPNLTPNQEFEDLYTKYTDLSKDKKQTFILQNLKKILNLSAKIAENQAIEEENGTESITSPINRIKKSVSHIAQDPFSVDLFMNIENAVGLDYLMKATACMIPGLKDSMKKDSNNINNIAENLYNYNVEKYYSQKRKALDDAIEKLKEPDLLKSELKNENEDSKKLAAGSKELHNRTEIYKGFHNKELEKFNNLYSIVNKITGDEKVLQDLSKTTVERQQFQDLSNLINLDHSLYILENEGLQKNEYYKTLRNEMQKFQLILPCLETWFAKKEKVKSIEDFSAQLNDVEQMKENDQKAISPDVTAKLLDTLKNLIEKNPVTADNSNAAIYTPIAKLLSNPNIATIIKQPKNLDHILNLSKFILKKNQDKSDLEGEDMQKINESYMALALALQEEQNLQEIQKQLSKTEAYSKVLENERESRKSQNAIYKIRQSCKVLSNLLKNLNEKYITKKDEDAISDADATKLINTFKKFIDSSSSDKPDPYAATYERATQILKDDHIKTVLKDKTNLSAFLQIADFVRINKELAALGKSSVREPGITEEDKPKNKQKERQQQEEIKAINTSFLRVENAIQAEKDKQQQIEEQPLDINIEKEEQPHEDINIEKEEQPHEGINIEKEEQLHEDINPTQKIKRSASFDIANNGNINTKLHVLDQDVDAIKQQKQSLKVRIKRTNSITKLGGKFGKNLNSYPINNEEANEIEHRNNVEEQKEIKKSELEINSQKHQDLDALIGKKCNLLTNKIQENQARKISVEEPVKIQTKKTNFVTTIFAWAASLFKRKSANTTANDNASLRESLQTINIPVYALKEEQNKLDEQDIVELNLERLNHVIDKQKNQKSIKIQTKKTNLITTLSSWFSRIFKKKTRNVTVPTNIDSALNTIGALDSVLNEVDDNENPSGMMEKPQVGANIISNMNDEEYDIDTEFENIRSSDLITEEIDDVTQMNLHSKPNVISNNEDQDVKNIFLQLENEAKKNPAEEADWDNELKKMEDKIQNNSSPQNDIYTEKDNKQINEISDKELDVIYKEIDKEQEEAQSRKNIINPTKFPCTFKEMSKRSYTVTSQMEQEFKKLQTDLIENQNHQERKDGAYNQPEYYANYEYLYKAMVEHPNNVIFIKLVSLLKCNDPQILKDETLKLYRKYGYSKDPKKSQLDPLLLLHLVNRRKILESLKTVKEDKKKIPYYYSEHLNLMNVETQEKPNICWSIALSNLLACKGIQISSEQIRATRNENINLDINTTNILGTEIPQYKHSASFYQNQRGAESSVYQGFKQISYLDVVKKYKCTETSYQDALIDNQNLNWNDWFVSQLKIVFGSTKNKKPSAMSLSNGHHIITIFGYKITKAQASDKITLFVHDSTLVSQKTKLPMSNKIQPISLDMLKKYFVNPYGVQSIAISYLENNNQSV